MLLYTLRQAVRSLGRNPVYSAMMVLGLGLGIALWLAGSTAVDSHTQDDLGDQPGLFHVSLRHRQGDVSDVLDTQRLWEVQNVRQLPLPYRDALALLDSDIPTRSAASFGTRVLTRWPAGMRNTRVRFCSKDLFAMFSMRFARGRGWSDGNRRVAVIEDAANRRWFGASGGLGRTVEIAGQRFTIVGVLSPDITPLRLFDFKMESTSDDLYLPIEQFQAVRARPYLLIPWAPHGASAADALGSDDAFVHLWARLPDRRRRQAFLAEVQARASARPEADLQPELRPFAEWRLRAAPRNAGYDVFAQITTVALVACCLNLVRLLIAKFQVRASEVSVRRALGASRGAIFLQHLVEAELVGAGGALLGLLLGWVGLVLINALVPDRPTVFTLDLWRVGLAVAVALTAALLSGLYPAWRICSVPPAVHLRRH